MSQQQAFGVGQAINLASPETSFLHQGGEDLGEEWEVMMGAIQRSRRSRFSQFGMGMSKWSRQAISSGIPAVFQSVNLGYRGSLESSHVSVQAN